MVVAVAVRLRPTVDRVAPSILVPPVAPEGRATREVVAPQAPLAVVTIIVITLLLHIWQ